MVKLTPPPAGVADRLVYDYLYQLQEYLGLALEETGAAAPAASAPAPGYAAADPADSSGDTALPAGEYQALKALVLKTAGEVRRGRAGRAIESVQALYARTDSPDSCQGAVWSADYPAGAGWLWTKLIVTYAGGETTETAPVCISGAPGASPCLLQIVSDNGGVFKNGRVSTVLRAKVWRGAEEVTPRFAPGDFRWTRSSADAAGDAAWNGEHFGGAKAVTVTSGDVGSRATFFCTLSEGAEEHEPARITAQPADFVGELGDSASFTVAAEGWGLTYRWQVWNNGWADSGSYGNKTATLSRIVVTEARLGYRYRCRVTDGNGNEILTREARMRLAGQEE